MRKEKAVVETRSAVQRMADLRKRKNFAEAEETAADRRRNVRSKLEPKHWVPPSGAINPQGGSMEKDYDTCPIPKEAAHGHTLWIGGAEPRAWIWCQMCGAHTSERVRSLKSECRGVLNTQQKRRLMGDRNPDDNTPLAHAGRPLTWKDIEGCTVDQAVEAYRKASAETRKREKEEKANADVDAEEKARADFGDSWHAYERECSTLGVTSFLGDAQSGDTPVGDHWCW